MYICLVIVHFMLHVAEKRMLKITLKTTLRPGVLVNSKRDFCVSSSSKC